MNAVEVLQLTMFWWHVNSFWFIDVPFDLCVRTGSWDGCLPI